MTTPDEVELVLALNGAPQSIRGEVRLADGATIPFRGWLELAAAIERARIAAEGDASGRVASASRVNRSPAAGRTRRPRRPAR